LARILRRSPTSTVANTSCFANDPYWNISLLSTIIQGFPGSSSKHTQNFAFVYEPISLLTHQIPQRILPTPPPFPVPPVPQRILAPHIFTIRRPIVPKAVFAVAVAGSVVVPVAECVFAECALFAAVALVAHVAQGVFAVGAVFLCGQPAGCQHKQCYGQGDHQVFRHGIRSHGAPSSGVAFVPV